MSTDSSALTPPPLPTHEAPVSTKPVSKFRWTIHLLLMAAIPLYAGFAGAAAGDRGPALSNNVRGLVISSAAELLFIGIPLALAWLVTRPSKDDLLLRWRPRYWALPLGAAYSVAIRLKIGQLAIDAATIAVASGKVTMADVQSFLESNSPKIEKLLDVHALQSDPVYYWLLITLVSFVLGGLREELWRSWFLAGMRGLWPSAFSSTGGGIAASAIVAVFFGVAHLPQGVFAALAITILGFCLGVIMVLHRSIWPSVIAHGLFDATTIALIPIVLEKAKHGG